MKNWKKWMANTAFDAAMPLVGVILFEGGPLLLLLLIIFLVWRAIKKVNKIRKEKRESNESETEKTVEKSE